jgi:RNA polymerase sigma-70 factor (ECF subfamily)
MYAEKLCRFVDQYVESPHVAEEIVQDLFFKIWRDRQSWNPTTNVRAYLYSMARNQALDYVKHEKIVMKWKEDTGGSSTASRPSPTRDLQRKELGRAIQDAIEELPQRQRTVFLLSRRHDMTYRDIALTLDISQKTVETHMSRAFRTLRELLANCRPKYNNG